ncbi:AsmA family protein [Marinicella sp. W31]|uniref:AsmA family protein n=1 Tax=Marinicella sp. W31 TaxID=3023713 RepID=UPI003757A11E
MKKIIKWLLRFVGVLILLLVIAIIVLPLVFDPNDHKERIQNLILENTGRNVQLKGEIGWSVFPTLALQFNDVEVANDSGFKGDYLARIGEVAAQVKVLPLLTKDIQIGGVELNQADINLQVNRQGRSNWQSIVDHLSADSPQVSETDGTATDSQLQIRGITIADGQVVYQDQQSATNATISNFNLDASAIGSDIETDLEIGLDLALPDSGLQTRIDTDVSLTNLLDTDQLKGVLKKLSINGRLSSESDVPFELKLLESGTLDMAADTLNLPGISLVLDDMEISTPVTASGLSGDMKMQGQLSIPTFDLGKLLQAMNAPLNNQANNQLAASAEWQLGNNRLRLNDLQLTLDDTKINGAADIKQLDQLRGTFNINVDRIALDQYIPGGEAVAETSTEVSNADYNFGFLDGTIAIGQLEASGATLDNISLSFISNGTGFRVRPLKADFYQGLLQTELNLDTTATSQKMKITHNMSNIQAGPLLTDIIGEQYLTGLGDLNANMSIDEPFSANPLQTTNGTISYKLSDGAIYGMDIFGMMRKGLSLLDNSSEESSDAEQKTDFAVMNINATITNGVLKTQQLFIDSPFFELDGAVEIDLSTMRIKGTISPMLTNIPENLLGSQYRQLLNVPIPVKLDGPLTGPGFNIDVKELLLATQKEKIDQKKDELKKDLLGKLLGDDDKEDQNNNDPSQPKKEESTEDKLKKDLLKSLLGGDDKDDTEEDPDGDG